MNCTTNDYHYYHYHNHHHNTATLLLLQLHTWYTTGHDMDTLHIGHSVLQASKQASIKNRKNTDSLF